MNDASFYHNLLKECGFDCTGECAASDLVLKPEVRAMCAADKCNAYGHNWACPPGCGELSEFQAIIDARSRCFVAQTVMNLEDEFDVETMLEAAEKQAERLETLHSVIKDRSIDVHILGSGTCTICPECSYPDSPCRFPELRLVSMEAAGLVVSEVCVSANIPYNHGKNTIAYTACILA